MKWGLRKGIGKSDKKRIRERIGKLQLEYLRLIRGPHCEIHPGRDCGTIGRMHILPVGKYPRLEFCDENVVLTGWFCSHFWTHHDNDDDRAIEAKRRICLIRGQQWDALLKDLKTMDRWMSPKNTIYLLAKEQEYIKKIPSMKGGL